jgi:hypothetical protein
MQRHATCHRCFSMAIRLQFTAVKWQTPKLVRPVAGSAPREARLHRFGNEPTRHNEPMLNFYEEPRALSHAPEDPSGRAYNEEAFRYFLANERNRSERSERPFLLLLVDLKKQPGASARFDVAVAAKLFTGLGLCLRETDFVGWYRDRRLAGAVLTQLPEATGVDLCRVVRQRASTALSESLPSDIFSRLQMRIFQLPPSSKDRS